MYKFSNKFVIILIAATVIIVGGASIFYSCFADDMYLNQQKNDITAAYESVSKLKTFSGKKFNKTVKGYEDEDFRFIIADENFQKVYSSYKNRDANKLTAEIRESKNLYDKEPLITVLDSQISGKVHKIKLTAKTSKSDGVYYIYIEESLATVEKSFSYTNKFLLCLVIVSMLVNAAAVYILCRKIGKPVTTLSEVTEKFKNGDFSARYEGAYSKDELGLLARNFNTMADKIQENISVLSNYNFLLREDVRMISEYEEMRKKVVRDITHDLKTPLAIISSQIEMMQIAKTNDKRKQYYDSAMEEITRMSAEISHILTAYKEPDASTVEETFDLGAEVSELYHEFEPYARTKGIKLGVEIGENFIVTSNKRHIRHIFNNYVLNAMSHVSREGSIRITLSKHLGCYMLSVYNDGEPIPEQSLEIIWNNFERGISEDSDNTRTGIGLYIVKEIATINGDECGVKNSEQGVTFWYKFKK